MSSDATVIAIDPDPQVLRIAEAKATASGAQIDFRRAFARDAATILEGRRAEKAVSSLVFHQTSVSEKRAGLAAVNAPLYRFLRLKRGWWFTLRAVPWHWFYFLYAALSFAAGAVLHLLPRARRRPPAESGLPGRP